MFILSLQHPDDPTPAYVNITAGKASGQWQQGTWETVQSLIQGQPVVLLIPTHSVLLTDLTLKTANSRQLKQALPYALEESLIGEPELQHFVWQAADTGEDLYHIAVIERAALKNWLQVTRQYRLKVRAILPDVFALPYTGQTLTVWQQDQYVRIRAGAYSGFSCPADAAGLLIDSYFFQKEQAHQDGETGNEAAVERQARLYSDQTEDWHQQLTITPESQPGQLTETHLQNAMALNLLQGYQDESMSDFSRQWKRWRPAAVLGILALAILLAYEGATTWKLKQRVDYAQQENLTLFKQVFPNISAIDPRDIRSRTRSEITLMERDRGQTQDKSSPLPYMMTIAKVFNTARSLKVTEVRSRQERLIVLFELPNNVELLEQLRQELNNQLGFQPTLTSTSSGNVLRATLTVEGQSS